MRQKQNWFFLASYILVTAIAFTTTYFAGYFTRAAVERNQTARDERYPLLAEVHNIVDTNFQGQMPTDTQLEYGLIRGLLTSLGDRYTIFLEPPAQELETQSLQGEFGGIGVNLRRDEAGVIVISPFPDLPAAVAGIQEGDVLVAIDGQTITPETSLDEVSALIRGPVDTEVTVTIQQSDALRDFKLKRQNFEIPSVTWRALEQDSTIGLVSVSRFSDKTPLEVQRALDDLQAKGVASIVLDLRGNGGGLLDSAINTAYLFLDGGVVMIEDRRGEAEQTYTAPGKGVAADLPLTVIINGGTASAAEILAGALRDRGRSPLIGQTSFGKGSVQLIFTLSDGSSIHVTNARWYTPNHTGIDGLGLKPDIEIQPGADGSDPELNRAVEYLQSLP
ncbi:MAG: S41 family peptidase [Chloroflexi bacterium]|nr:S41 family peptidase [Chloroflexota bacterium]